ncbi:uncharacterized protein LOC110232994 [Exaiptasia diaphana]|uniref:Uncharacterized protein n=1 Tax=Exaiptasia diaphana TaxID=2652724 RepID=A0A913WTJ8_EXADI|nr:uncharacterized protein LOC110232994 [Exaiptasia diaphana]
MPNTGQVQGQAYKCEKCRKNFKTVWLPTNPCCRMKLDKEGSNAVYSSTYSRHLSPAIKTERSSTVSSTTSKTSTPTLLRKLEAGVKVQRRSDPRFKYVNSLAPFSTLGKPTCGYYFSHLTDNKKYKTGIPPSDLVAWRSHIS